MDEQLMDRLKEFYKLEKLQVAFYKAQMESLTDEYELKAFQKLVEIEEGHVDFFTQWIERSGELVPSFAGSFFELAGRFVEDAVELTGQRNTFQLGIKLESAAMEHYQKFIQESKEKHYTVLCDQLMEYLLDEEFHKLWLKDFMNNRLK